MPLAQAGRRGTVDLQWEEKKPILDFELDPFDRKEVLGRVPSVANQLVEWEPFPV